MVERINSSSLRCHGTLFNAAVAVTFVKTFGAGVDMVSVSQAKTVIDIQAVVAAQQVAAVAGATAAAT